MPDRVNVIRVMLSELFRINSHLLYISTFIQDVGAMTPVFFLPLPTVRKFTIWGSDYRFPYAPGPVPVSAVWHDLPRGWDRLLREFLDWMPKRLASYEKSRAA